jgi:hypothetical protein
MLPQAKHRLAADRLPGGDHRQEKAAHLAKEDLLGKVAKEDLQAKEAKEGLQEREARVALRLLQSRSKSSRRKKEKRATPKRRSRQSPCTVPQVGARHRREVRQG